MWDLVENPEDRFSGDAANIKVGERGCNLHRLVSIIEFLFLQVN